MSEANDLILQAAVTWHRRHRARLAALGVEARLVGPTVDRSKNSATIEFISPECLVGVTIWDSGECEVITAFVSVDDDPIVLVHDLADPEAVAVRLDRIVTELTTGREQ